MPLRPPDLQSPDSSRNAGARAELRLAELVASFSLVCDLSMGHPSDEAMRACLLATALARQTGRGEEEVAVVYWTTLLAHAGCTAFAHEQAALFAGDEIVINAAGSKTDFQSPREVLAFLAEVVRGRTALDGARIVIGGVVAGKGFDRALATANCEIAGLVAHRLGLGPAVEHALLELFERWDGTGAPAGKRGDEIAPAARFAQLAHQAVVFARIGGADAVIAMARRRSARALDPSLAAALARDGHGLVGALDTLEPTAALLAAEPAPHQRIPADRLRDVARVFAEVVDLKSPLLMGHSTGVAELAEAAARKLGMPAAQTDGLRIAGLLHDIGRVAVPNGIWEKPGPLARAEWEQVRLHAYHTERILLRAPTLAPLAAAAGMHHERLDGSGYHRGIGGAALPPAARVLAAADVYQAMCEPRRHRPALGREEAAVQLAVAAETGALDPAAVDALLAAVGAPRRIVRTTLPGNLTEREIDVLRLAALGLPNREIGRRLFIAPKTVGRHIENIYGKLGIRSRAAAALFAAENGLVGREMG